MDHLPRPTPTYYLQNGQSRPPYSKLLADLHDGLSREAFELYPGRRGLARQVLETGAFPLDQSQRATALVQNWLFFGLLEEVLRVDVPIADFTKRGESDDLFLSTHLLGSYVEQWKDDVEKCGDDERVAWATRLRHVFRQATAFFQLYATGLRQHYPDDFVDYLNPLLVLLETLQQHVTDVFADGQEHEPLPTNFSPSAGHQLIRRGWCPFTIANILLPSSSPCLFEYVRLFRDHPPFIHQAHAGCDANHCTTANVDTSTYQTRHNQIFCRGQDNCELLYPDTSIIKTALDAGNIPVISLSTSNHQPRLTTLSATEGAYIAISHVWADGMGSTSEKGIPTCVAAFLADAATAASTAISDNPNAVAQELPFWIDSLCVPAQPDLRRKAIGLMAETYASAAAVVVVDASMRFLSVADPVPQLLLVLYVSNWVQRLWTLQEALLSRQLFFTVGDGLVDAMCFFADNVTALRLGDAVVTKLLGWFAQMMVTPLLRRAAAPSGGLPLTSKLDDVVMHLAKRTSSRSADETLAVAGLFGLDAGELVALDAEERMVSFLGQCHAGRVPRDIVFLEGDKLAKRGWGWAPKSFMQKRLGLELKGGYEEDMAVVTEGGLVALYYCLLLENEAGTETKPERYRVRCEDGAELVVIFERKPGGATAEELAGLRYDVLVLSRPVEKGEEFLAIGANLIENLSIDGDDGEGVLCLQLICYVHVFNEGRNEAWQGIPSVYTSTSSLRTVLLS